MAERKTYCPECASIDIKIEILNPDTLDMNSNANIVCNKCDHVWLDKVSSPLYKSKREKGYLR